jgi:hypothetical protein
MWIRKEKNVVFGWISDQQFNVIKSPIRDEHVHLCEQLEKRRIYSRIKDAPPHPYTIAFIASPYYMSPNPRNQGCLANEDPIMDDETLFYRSVDRALETFEFNEILGHPDVWSRTRIITIFPRLPKDHVDEDYAFVAESSCIYGDPLLGVNDIVSPRVPKEKVDNSEQEVSDIRAYISNKLNLCDEQKEIFKEVDVIYFMTANVHYIRSSARPSEGIIDGFGQEEYHYSSDPPPPNAKCLHEGLSQLPGMVALNVIYARQKTYIHEFAHAMAHAEHGAIFDEYYDTDHENTTFAINSVMKDQGEFFVDKRFAEYLFPKNKKGILYYSDRDHPSAEQNWRRQFPLRESKYIGCIMDRTIGDYQFDKLLSAFMYDRLISKIKRS